MAQKVILGKSNHSNLGNSSTKHGVWACRDGEESISSCTKDELVLSTDVFGNASGAVDVGQMQVIPTSGTTASQQVSINANTTVTVSYANQNTAHNFVQGYFSRGEYSSTSSNISQYMNTASYGGSSSVAMSNGGGNAITGQVTTWRGFSNLTLF